MIYAKRTIYKKVSKSCNKWTYLCSGGDYGSSSGDYGSGSGGYGAASQGYGSSQGSGVNILQNKDIIGRGKIQREGKKIPRKGGK